MAVRKKYNSSALGRGLDNISSGRGLGLDALIDTSDIEIKGTSNLNEIAISQIEPSPIRISPVMNSTSRHSRNSL